MDWRRLEDSEVTQESPPPATQASAPRVVDQLGPHVGKYEIIRPLGRGGMGEVVLARDTYLGRLVALKVITRVTSSEQTERFLAEARVTAQLQHENVVVVYEVGKHHGFPYMVLEYLQGQTLYRWWQSHGHQDERGNPAPVSPVRAAELAAPIARALVSAHRQGIAHCDLKPDNIMLTEGGTLKVFDFGIARWLQPHGSPAPNATPSPLFDNGLRKITAGTPPYMAPEQWHGEGGPLSDVWALGIILWELAVGEHPLAPLSEETWWQVRDMTLPMPRAIDDHPELGALGAVIDRCLIKDPEDRMQSAAELLAALEAILRPRVGAWLDEDRNPFLGLAAFQEADANRFFGRDAAIVQAHQRLEEQPIVVVVGPSGVGKSSFVRAGVIPALKRSGYAWESLTLRPGSSPMATLAHLLEGRGWHSTTTTTADSPAGRSPTPEAPQTMAEIEQRLRDQSGFLGVALRERAQRRRERLLLLVDQFEELFTLASREDEATFWACLEGAADHSTSPVRVVITLRADFLERFIHLAQKGQRAYDVTGRGLMMLPPVGLQGLREALERPVQAAQYSYESPGLVERMIETLDTAAGALPLLQFAAARLWEQRDPRRRVLTVASYELMGGVAGALAHHADTVLQSMGAVEKACTRAVFLRLVTPERTRTVVPLSELKELSNATLSQLESVLSRLIENRLLTVTGSGRDSEVEIVHESLLQAWPTLAQWLDEHDADAKFLTRVRSAAIEWKNSAYDAGLLWRGQAAQEAEAWVDSTTTAASLRPAERRFLEAVTASRRRMRLVRRRATIGAFVAVSLVALSVSYLALLAQRESSRARNALRVAIAREHLDAPTTALDLLRSAEPEGGVPRGWRSLARWALAQPLLRTEVPHEAAAPVLAVAPGGTLWATGTQTGEVWLWEARPQLIPRILQGHRAAITALDFAPDGSQLLSGADDGSMRLWTLPAGEGSAVVVDRCEGIADVAVVDPGRALVVCQDGRAHWLGVGGAPVVDSRIDVDQPWSAAAVSQDGAWIALGARSGVLHLLRAYEGRWLSDPATFRRGHEGRISDLAFSPDGQRLVSGAEDGTVRLWPLGESAEARMVHRHAGAVNTVAFDDSGTRVVSASADTTLWVGSVDAGREATVLKGRAAPVLAASFSHQGRGVVSIGNDNTLRLWQVSSGHPAEVRCPAEPGTVVYQATFSPDGRSVAAAADDGTVTLWRNGRRFLLQGHQDAVLSVGFLPDGTALASASRDGSIRIWSVSHPSREPHVLAGEGGWIEVIAVALDGRIVAGTADGKVQIWPSGGRGVPRTLGHHSAAVHSVDWSPDAKQVVTSSHDGEARLWHVATGESRVLKHKGPVWTGRFSPDGTQIVTGSDRGLVRLWSTVESSGPTVLAEQGRRVYSAVFSPSGDRVATGSIDGTVQVIDLDAPREPIVLRGHGREVLSVSFSPDGRELVSASGDGSIRVWRNLAPLGLDDPRLWEASNVCLDTEDRRALVGVPDRIARHEERRCHERRTAFSLRPWVQTGCADMDDVSTATSPVRPASTAMAMKAPPIPVDPAVCAGEGVICVGLLYPFTAPDRYANTRHEAHQLTRAVSLAVDEINAQGGVLGRRLVVVRADTVLDVRLAQMQARRLVETYRVRAILGPLFSRLAIPVLSEVTVPAGVPVFSTASADELTEGERAGLYFRGTAKDAWEAELAAGYIRNRLRSSSVAVLAIDDPFGRGLARGFARRFEALGGQVTDVVYYPQSPPADRNELNPLVKTLLSKKPEVVYLVGTANTVTQHLIGQVFRGGPTGRVPDVFACGSIVQEKVLDYPPFGGSIFGIRKNTFSHPAFDRAFARFFGTEDSGFFTATAYDAVYLIAYAILAAGGVEPSAFASHVSKVSRGGIKVGVGEFARARALLEQGEDIDYDGASGALAIGPNGDLVSQSATFWKVQNGRASMLDQTAQGR